MYFQAVGAAGGADAGEEEGFVGVDVADTGDGVLIEEEGLDGAGAGGCEVGGGDGEGIGAELGPGAHERCGVGESPEAAEAARVLEGEAAFVEVPEGVEVWLGVEVGGVVAPGEAAGHAEVDAEDAAACAEECELLAAAFDGGDAMALEELGGGSAVATVADVGATEFGAADGLVEEVGEEGLADSLDLREFGHEAGYGA